MLTDTFIATMAHEVNRIYCTLLGDDSQVEWKDAPEWQKQSAINGVAFHREHPDATAESSHENWWADKREEGWVYGPVKDPIKKEHPCCVPYTELPLEQQVKDTLFKAIVTGLLKHQKD